MFHGECEVMKKRVKKDKDVPSYRPRFGVMNSHREKVILSQRYTQEGEETPKIERANINIF